MNWKRLLWGKWNWRRPLQSLACIYLGVTAFGLLACNRLIFQPPPARATAESAVTFLPGDGDKAPRIACLHRAPERDGAPLLLWSHGNAEDLGTLRPLLEELHALGFGILAYDYPGYGGSGGSPTERSCYDAIARVWIHATQDLGIPAKRIVIVGQSVGSGPATWLAEREAAAGLVLISPFLSAYRTLTQVPLFPGDRFNNMARIRSVAEPLLVMHGTRDGIIAFSHGERLYARHPGPKTFLAIEGAGHNDIWRLGFRQMTEAMMAHYRRHADH